MDAEPVTDSPAPPASEDVAPPTAAPRTSVLRGRKGRMVLIMVLAVVLAIPAIFVPFWWATLPLLSLFGLVAWKGPYWLAGVLGGIVGALFWVAELEFYPSAAVTRLTAALAGAEGFTPTVLFLLGPLLFGLLAALAALTVAGGLRLVRPAHE